MPGLLKTIFHPHDGTRRKVQQEVVKSRVDVQKASNRLEETIRDLLDSNDKLTGRKHAFPNSQTGK